MREPLLKIVPLSPAQVLRRRAMPLASAVVATMGMAGCAGTPAAAPAAATITPEQRMADQRVRSFTSDIESALDTVDRDRLRAAAVKKSTPEAVSPVVPPAPVAALSGTSVMPMVVSAPIETITVSGAALNAPAADAPSHEPSDVPTGSSAATSTPAAAIPATVVAAPPVASIVKPESASAARVAKSTPVAETPLFPPLSAAALAASHSPRLIETGVGDQPAPVATQKPDAEPAATATETHSAPAAAPAAPAPEPQMSAGPAVASASTAIITPPAPRAAAPASAMGAMNAIIVPEEIPADSVISPAAAAVVAPVSAPAVTPQVPPAEPTIEEALSVLRKKIASNPTMSTALALALLENGDNKIADLDIAKKLPDSDQKVVGDLIAAIESMQAPAGPATTISERTAPLRDAAKKWQSEADLSLPRLVLATRVDSFGVYSAIEPRFEQGKRHTVIIYCEVANFASKKGEDGWFTTHLAQQETLITEDGLLVWRPNAEDVDDRSMNQRRDFYLVKKLTIPENLATGKYTLRMSVTDKTSGKISLMSLPVEIVSK